jgi:hypothetical protein
MPESVKTSQLKLDHLFYQKQFFLDAMEGLPVITVEREESMLRQVGEEVIRMRAHILAHQLDHRYHQVGTAAYPLTVWDHIKRDWLPTFTRWFRLKPPMLKRDVFGFEVKDYHAFPESTYHYPPELGAPVLVQQVEHIHETYDKEAF